MLGGMSIVQPLWTDNPVAANVRAELARKGLNANRLPALLGKTQAYWSRRTRGEVALDANDLVALAELLSVDPGVFFVGATLLRGTQKPLAEDEGLAVRRQGLEPRTRYISASGSQDGIARILGADSNPDLCDSWSERPADVVRLPTWRNLPGVMRDAKAGVR